MPCWSTEIIKIFTHCELGWIQVEGDTQIYSILSALERDGCCNLKYCQNCTLLLSVTDAWKRKMKAPCHPNTNSRLDSMVVFKEKLRTSLVAQWLRIRLPMQGTRVRSLAREDPTCCGATKPVHYNYRSCALEPVSHNY